MTATSGTGGKMKESSSTGIPAKSAASAPTSGGLDKKEAKKLRSYESRKVIKNSCQVTDSHRVMHAFVWVL